MKYQDAKVEISYQTKCIKTPRGSSGYRTDPKRSEECLPGKANSCLSLGGSLARNGILRRYFLTYRNTPKGAIVASFSADN